MRLISTLALALALPACSFHYDGPGGLPDEPAGITADIVGEDGTELTVSCTNENSQGRRYEAIQGWEIECEPGGDSDSGRVLAIMDPDREIVTAHLQGLRADPRDNPSEWEITHLDEEARRIVGWMVQEDDDASISIEWDVNYEVIYD